MTREAYTLGLFLILNEETTLVVIENRGSATRGVTMGGTTRVSLRHGIAGLDSVAYYVVIFSPTGRVSRVSTRLLPHSMVPKVPSVVQTLVNHVRLVKRVW